jgi:hypothetical protein
LGTVLGFGDRSKRIAKIAGSATPHLEAGEEVRELVQVQTGRTAEHNRWAVVQAGEYGEVNWREEGTVQSLAVLATDRNVYVVTLTGVRLLDVGQVAFKQPLADAPVTVEDKVITVDDVPLHVMNHYESHVVGLRDLLAAAKATA